NCLSLKMPGDAQVPSPDDTSGCADIALLGATRGSTGAIAAVARKGCAAYDQNWTATGGEVIKIQELTWLPDLVRAAADFGDTPALLHGTRPGDALSSSDVTC